MNVLRSPCLLCCDKYERNRTEFQFADRLRVIAEERATIDEFQIVSFPAANRSSTICSTLRMRKHVASATHTLLQRASP
jgi:hypothetical protein